MSATLRGLALRLEGPLQSWGVRAQGDTVPTADAPTKSGLAGLLGAALGVPRGDRGALDALGARFHLAVRLDRPGRAAEDYHTVADVPAPEGARTKGTVISRRWYLHDASFAAVLVETAPGSLDPLLAALQAPVWAPYLGRRSCPPSEPVLALPGLLTGTWDAMLDAIPRAARATGRDVRVCATLLDGGVPAGYRLIRTERVEDAFARRAVAHLRRDDRRAAAPSRAVDTVTGWMPGDAPPVDAERDTTEDWMP